MIRIKVNAWLYGDHCESIIEMDDMCTESDCVDAAQQFFWDMFEGKAGFNWEELDD